MPNITTNHAITYTNKDCLGPKACVCVCVVDDELKKPTETSEWTKVPLHYFSRVSVHLFHESFMNICLFISQLKLFILSYCATNDGISLPSPLGKNGIQNGGQRRKMRRSRL